MVGKLMPVEGNAAVFSYCISRFVRLKLNVTSSSSTTEYKPLHRKNVCKDDSYRKFHSIAFDDEVLFNIIHSIDFFYVKENDLCFKYHVGNYYCTLREHC